MAESSYDAMHAAHTRAFAVVEPEGHWKDPIDATVTMAEIDAVGGTMAVRDAVVHFTATCPSFEYGVGNVRVKADGYRNGPAGDG